MSEQVELLRRLVDRAVGDLRRRRYEHVTGAGLAPLPVQRPIPVWFGAASEPAYRRAGRLADGWFPHDAARARSSTRRARSWTQAAATPAATPRRSAWKAASSWTDDGVDKLVDHVGRWRDAGATPRGGQHDERRPRIGRRPPRRAHRGRRGARAQLIEGERPSRLRTSGRRSGGTDLGGCAAGRDARR